MAGKIYVGIGGWTFEPWRGVFYPEGLTHKRELEYASRKLTSIEINGTYYSSFKPASWAKWRAETPDGFVFAMKASRFCTNRRVLAEAGESIERYVNQGLVELGDRLGPINWQFMATKKFDPEDIEAFLKLLPRAGRQAAAAPCAGGAARELQGPALLRPLRASTTSAIIYAHDEDFPEIDEPTADFTYARLMGAQDKVKTGYKPADIDKWAKKRQGVGQERRRLHLLHLRRQGAQSRGRAGADRQGLASRRVAFMVQPFPSGLRVEEIEDRRCSNPHPGRLARDRRSCCCTASATPATCGRRSARRWSPDHTVIVPDLRGMGLSSHPEQRLRQEDARPTTWRACSTRSEIDRAATSSPTTSATWWATPSRRSIRTQVTRWVVMDAPLPGIGPWDELLKSPMLWHFNFRGPDVERLVAGRERIYLDRFYNELSATPSAIDEATRHHYAALYARPGAMHSRVRAVRRLHARTPIDNKVLRGQGQARRCRCSRSAPTSRSARPWPTCCASWPATSRGAVDRQFGPLADGRTAGGDDRGDYGVFGQVVFQPFVRIRTTPPGRCQPFQPHDAP